MPNSKTEKLVAKRRAFLVRALAAGLFAAGGLWSGNRFASAQVLGRVPRPLAKGQSIYDVTGPVMINGKLITRDARIGPNDTVETGKGARAIFVVGSDAFLLRADSRLEMKSSDTFVNVLRLITGALLSVYGGGPRTVTGPNAVLGIRGTGLYVEAEPDLTYVCTCYGETDIAAADDSMVTETIVSVHHDAPRYVLAKPEKGRRIVPAPFKNHDDLELMLIESLVGRTPPFALFDESYGSPRRY
jgi:hypothetical protein